MDIVKFLMYTMFQKLVPLLCSDKCWRVRKIAKSDYQLRHVCPSACPPSPVRMEQLGSHWTYFYEILHIEHVSKICRENSNFH